MSKPITHRIYEKMFALLEQHPEGLRRSELLKRMEELEPDAHPKTVNGCLWKLVEKYPSEVYKPSKGVFRLLKYQSSS